MLYWSFSASVLISQDVRSVLHKCKGLKPHKGDIGPTCCLIKGFIIIPFIESCVLEGKLYNPVLQANKAHKNKWM